MVIGPIVPLKYIEYGFGYTIIRCPRAPYSSYLRGTISYRAESFSVTGCVSSGRFDTCGQGRMQIKGFGVESSGFQEVLKVVSKPTTATSYS